MKAMQASKLIGTALICFGLLSFEIVTARILGVVLETHLAIFAIALAMLGMGAATSAMSLGDSPERRTTHPLFFSYTGAFLGLSYVACFVGIAIFNVDTNADVENAIDQGGLSALVDSIRNNMSQKIFTIGAILFAPYFIFGIFIAKLFQSSSEADFHMLYAADLVGAALGCILAVVSLDYFGYAGGLGLVLVSTFLGAAAFSGTRSIRSTAVNIGLAVVVLLVANSPETVNRLEPHPAMSQLSRNYSKSFEVTEDWHLWNAHSRIALLTMRQPNTGEMLNQVYAHESGDGWATVPHLSNEPAPWAELATVFKPKRVLVLFAGVGRDMIDIDHFCGGTCEITGVEINRHMVDHALNNGPEHIATFLARPDINLEVAEAREFLERDTSTYDTILLSWWGAGTSHYVGTSGRLAGYLYTKEAYERLLDHLRPGGTIMMFNGSKAQSLVNFREVFQERGLGSLADSVVLFREQSDGSFTSPKSFYDILEKMRLVIKPSGFTESELEAVRAISARMNASMILTPDGSAAGFEIYREIVQGADLQELNSRLIASHGTELSIVTDDRPFINELVPRSYYLDLNKWFGSEKSENPLWEIARGYLAFILILSMISAVMILAPLVVKSGPGFSRHNFVYLFYFLSLGAGFILIEVGFVRKLGLLMGHPSYSLSVVLAGLIFSTGIGSLFSQKAFGSGKLTIRRTAVLIVGYTLIGTLLYENFVDVIITLPLAIKGLIVILYLFPLGFLMGQLFPQGLVKVSRVDQRLVPWAWAINSVSSTIFVGVGYLLSYPLGFSSLVYLGVAFYAIVVILPVERVHEQFQEREDGVAVAT